MSCSTGAKSSGGTPQAFVDQRPKWDNQVISRKTKIIRRDKRKMKRKFY